MVNPNSSNGSWNALADPSNMICILNKTEDGVNLSVFEMISRVNESEVLAKHILCKRICRFDGRK